MKLAELRTSLLDNGDVLISSSYESQDGKVERRFTTMFEGKSIDEARSDLGRDQIVLGDGTLRRVVARGSASAILKDGDKVTVIPHVYRRCYRGPVRYVLARLDSLGQIELMNLKPA